LTIATIAFGITDPELSTTVPVMEPVMVWALALKLQSARTNDRHTKRLSLPINMPPLFLVLLVYAFADENEEII
jgi:hypothetical protein